MKKFLSKIKSLGKGKIKLPFVKGKGNKTKNKSTNIFSRIGGFLVPKYFKDSWKEIKKVTWPSRKESLKLTFAVAIFTLFFTLVTALADQGFSWLIERIVL